MFKNLLYKFILLGLIIILIQVNFMPVSAESNEAPSPDSPITINQEKLPLDQNNKINETTNNIENKKSFVSAFFGMLISLTKVILFILFIYALILLYKKYKNINALKQISPLENSKEPETISEAVSSYVKHKIKDKND